MHNLEISKIVFCASNSTQFNQFASYSSDYDKILGNFKKFILEMKKLTTLNRVVFISSAGALYKSDQLITEVSELNLLSTYAKLKFEMERILIDASLTSNFDCQIIRATNVYGLTLNNKIRGGFINELIRSAVGEGVFFLDVNYKTIRKNFIYIGDLVKIILHLIFMDTKCNLTLNVANDRSLTLEEAFLICNNVLDNFDLRIEYRTKDFANIGNLNQDFDLSLLRKYMPGYLNTDITSALAEIILQITGKS